MDYLISENHLSLDVYHLWRDGMISNQAWEILKKTIDRQPKLDALDSVFIDDESYKVWFKLAVKNLPSAGPEPKTGKWIEKEICETRRKEEMQVAKCSNCKKYLTTPYFYSFTHYNFCPNCGAKMGGY